jgi:DNA-binding GntR family transcriptional regulator
MIDNDAYIREAVETKIIKDAISNITPNDIAILKEILKEQEQITNMEPSIEKSKLFNENDNKFHIEIFRIAGHQSLWQDMVNSTINFDRVRIMSNLRTVGDVKEVYQYHCLIVKYLEEKNVELAQKAFSDHIALALHGIGMVEEKYHDYFVEE